MIIQPVGFDVIDTGGGCTAWCRVINSRYHILVTDQQDNFSPRKWPVDMGLRDTINGGPEVTLITGVTAAQFENASHLLSLIAEDLTASAPSPERMKLLLRDGIAAAEKVIGCWSDGDLAASVRELDAWLRDARK